MNRKSSRFPDPRRRRPAVAVACVLASCGAGDGTDPAADLVQAQATTATANRARSTDLLPVDAQLLRAERDLIDGVDLAVLDTRSVPLARDECSLDDAPRRLRSLAADPRFSPVRAELKWILGRTAIERRRRDFEAVERLARRGAELCRDYGLTAHAYGFQGLRVEAYAEGYREAEVAAHAARLIEEVDGTPFRRARGEFKARLAQALHARGRQEEAWEVMQESLGLLRDYPDSRAYAFASDEAAWLAGSRGFAADGMRLLEDSLAAARAANDLDRLARGTRSRALMQSQRGFVAESISGFDSALDVAAEAGLGWRWANIALYRADAHHRLGDDERARRWLDYAADAIAELPVDDPWLEARHLGSWCEIAASDGSTPPAAISARIAALTPRLPTRDRFSLLTELFELELRYGDADRALDAARGLVEFGDGVSFIKGCIAQGALARSQRRLGAHEDALHSLETALRICEEVSSQLSRVDDRLEVASLAGRFATLAVEIAADLYAQQPSDSLAARVLLYLDFGRARSILDRPRLEGHGPTWETLGFDESTWLESRATRLGENDLLLAYDLTAQVAVAASRTHVAIHRLPEVNTLERDYEFAAHHLLQIRDETKYRRAARRIAAEVIDPFDDLLRHSDRVLLLPSGALHRLPLELLPRRLDDDADSATGAYLFETHVVETIPCLGSLAPFDADRDTPRRMLILAHSPTVGEAAPGLPAVEAEAHAIAAVARSAGCAVTLNPRASESQVKELRASDYDCIYFAAHAFADRARGRHSGISLAPRSRDEDALTIDELVELALALKVAVVSGCEGAEGKTYGVEGVVSVGHGLLAAGSRAAVVATAPVPDDRVRRLLVPFCESLLSGHDPAAALRMARLSAWRDPDREAKEAALLPFLVLGTYGGSRAP